MIEYVKRLAGPFTAEGQTDLPFGFKIFEPTDVFVATSTDPNTSSSMLVYGKDYLVNMNPDQEAVPGGKVVLKAPVAKGQVVVVGSAVAYTQNMQLTNFSRFPPEIINESLDRIVVQIQQLVELTGRTISLPPTSNLTVSEFLDNLFNAAKSAAKSAEEAKKFAQICEEIKQSIFIYSWDIPHVVDTLDDVEKYPYDGLFAVGGYGDPGHHGQDISNRVVKASGSTELRTLGERFADVVNVRDFGAVGDGVTDDTAAIQAANNFAMSVGKGLCFPSGVYPAHGLQMSACWDMEGTAKLLFNGSADESCVTCAVDGLLCGAISIDANALEVDKLFYVSGNKNHFDSITLLNGKSESILVRMLIVEGNENFFGSVVGIDQVKGSYWNDSSPQCVCLNGTATGNSFDNIFARNCRSTVVNNATGKNFFGNVYSVDAKDNGFYAVAGSSYIDSIFYDGDDNGVGFRHGANAVINSVNLARIGAYGVFFW